jgi:hypothetical protein
MQYEKIKVGAKYNFFRRDARTSEKVLPLKVIAITPFGEIDNQTLNLFRLENVNEYFTESFWLIERPTFIVKAKLLLEGKSQTLLFAENQKQQLQCFGHFFWEGFLDYDNTILNEYINQIENEITTHKKRNHKTK